MPSRYEKFQAYRVVFIEARSPLVRTFDRKQMEVPFSKQKNHGAVHRTCLLYSISTSLKKKITLSEKHSVGSKSLEKSENVRLRVPQKSYIMLLYYCSW